ncbi:MAG: rhodanese-like domain-containing protein [Gammaproteobacteria bacterium]|nr:rhodanese-like domain-containing protein [Gammaproteobacteria bacterium]
MQKTNPGRALTLAAALMLSAQAPADDVAVKITSSLDAVTTRHEGRPIRIQRDQNQANTITPAFQKTSRRCPPFCVQPMRMPDGVETIGELEMLDYLRRVGDGDDSVLVIDSRGPDWVERGTIPGSVNIHYKRLSLKAADEESIAKILERDFDAERLDTLWNFRHAKTLILFCNGPWCGQSPTNIRALLRFGYPPTKIKWYRGGMQAWEVLGLTTVKPGE